MKTKRTYKDSLFRHIFKNKTRLSKLYKALSGNDVPPQDITINLEFEGEEWAKGV